MDQNIKKCVPLHQPKSYLVLNHAAQYIFAYNFTHVIQYFIFDLTLLSFLKGKTHKK